MIRPPITLDHLIDTLQSENLLIADDDTLTDLHKRTVPQPWYIRTMVGFGAWLASLLLIGFVASLSLAAGGDYIFVGGVLIACAVLIRHKASGDFLIQCAIASSLAGQALVAFGFTDATGHDEVEAFLGTAVVLSTLLFFIFPDRIHRVIMVLLGCGSLTTLLYFWEVNALIPFLGPMLTGILIALHIRLPKLASSRHALLIQPLMSGLMLSAFGNLMLSTVYLLPELKTDFVFYPRPWISTILLGVEFVYFGNLIWPDIAGTTEAKIHILFNGLMIAVIACAWHAPGLILGLIVILIGVQSGRITFTGAGIGFFALFLTAFFYGIEVSLLMKSITLLSTGIAILILRWFILNLAAREAARGASHA